MFYGTLTADGTGQPFIAGTGTAESAGAGKRHLRVHGAWGGGTFKLQIEQDDGSWSDLFFDGSAITYTADDEDIYEFVGPVKLRTVLSGSTAPSLYWEVR